MLEKAIVTQSDNKTISVKMVMQEACSTCSSHGVCFGFGLDSNKNNSIEVNSTIAVNKGDLVEIKFPQNNKFLFSLILFGMPIISAIIGYYASEKIFGKSDDEIFGVLGSVLFFVVYFFIIAFIPKIKSDFLNKKPQIINVLK